MVGSSSTPYKPSPLSFGSPRTSPFRRPSVASSPTTFVTRPSQPASPANRGSPVASPSKLSQLHTPEDDDVFSSSPTIRNRQSNSFSAAMASQTSERQIPTERRAVNGDILTKLPPAQLRELREAFQVLDRDNDGLVNKDDVADILLNLGQDSSPSALAAYFPPDGPQTINLPTFLNKVAFLLSPLSSSQELLNAFAAFDEDDSGQIDLNVLRDALLHTSPDSNESPLTEREIDEAFSGFTGRRAFGGRGAKSGAARNRGDVFRYQEFVNTITGGQGANKADDAAAGGNEC
ncbi:hypothetical protein VTO42DRAFT_6702 [Malbranchea cinnamomea]